MPQGGIDADENPREAVMRELWEETGVEQRRLSRRDRLADVRISALRRPAVAPAGEIPRPAAEMVRVAFHRTRRRDRSADAAQRPTGGVRPWRWERLDRVADLVVPFRREVYRAVAREFERFAR